MNERRFYQPSRTSVERAAKLIAARAASQNMRTLLVHKDETVLQEIYTSIWQDEAFTTVALKDEPHRDAAMVVLSDASLDGFDCQIICHDNETNCASALTCYIFAQDDEFTKKIRRVQWSEWRLAGGLLTYWTETETGWEKTAEVNADAPPTNEA